MKLIRSYIITIGFYVGFIAIANIFGLGSSDYLEDSAYFGAGRVNATKALMIFTLTTPLFFRFYKDSRTKYLYIFIVLAGIIFILIGIKRSALLGLLLGSIVYAIFTPYRGRNLKILLVIFLLLTLVSSFFIETFQERFEHRQEQGRFDPSQAQDEESRVIELYRVADEFKKQDLVFKLFGSDLFNSMAYYRTVRMLHTNIATIWSGSGIVGLALFSLITILILKKAINYYFYFKQDPVARDITAVLFAVIAGALLTAVSGSVTSFAVRSASYLFYGATFGLLDSYIRSGSQIILPKKTK